jgi:hypothetical protein
MKCLTAKDVVWSTIELTRNKERYRLAMYPPTNWLSVLVIVLFRAGGRDRLFYRWVLPCNIRGCQLRIL